MSATDTPKHPHRQTKLTPDVQTKVVQALQLGMYIVQACEAVGITNTTYHSWILKGKTGKAPYAAFFEATAEASAKAEADALAKIRKGEPNWQAQAWFLERRHRERWGRTVDNSGIADTPTTKQLLVKFVGPGELPPGTGGTE